MVTSWITQHARSYRAKLSQSQLEDVTVGDADPTCPRDGADGHRMCRFEWADETSPTFRLLWTCTREWGHRGRHVAGTGDRVAAVCDGEGNEVTKPTSNPAPIDE
jgi:hypothetical protein